jgi:hypothetical protein
MANKNKYTVSGQEKSLVELVTEISSNASDTSFEKFWEDEPEEIVEIAINKTNLINHIKKIAEYHGEMSAPKACVLVNNEFSSAYTVQEIKKVWEILDAEWKKRQAEDQEEE